jgi:hypothetical protein
METSRLSGPRIGPSVAATFSFGSDWFVAGDGRLSFGLLDYEGGTEGRKDGNQDVLWDVRVKGGKDIFFEHLALGARSATFSISPFIGLGLRAESTDLRGRTDAGVMGYRFHNEFAYALIGVTPRFRLDSESRISTDIEYDQLIFGRRRAYASDVGPGFEDSTTYQHRGYGVRGSIRYETDRWAVGPFATFWSIADPSRYYFEPRNTSWEGGLRASYRF